MPSIQLLFCLLVACAFSYTIASSNEDTGDCLPARRDTLVEVLSSTTNRCINMTSPSFPGFSSKLQLSECLAYTEAFCRSLPTVRQCIDEESNRWSRCYEGKFSKVYTLFKDTVKVTLDDLCEDNGEKLSRFLYSFNTNTLEYRAKNAFVRECIMKLSYRLNTADRSEANLPTKYWYVYKEIGKFKNCISEYFQGDNETVIEAVQHINRTLDTMKCLHPENESEILCKNLDSVIDRTELCPLKTNIEGIEPLSLLIETRTFACFAMFEGHSPVLSEARSLEDFEEYFRHYCRRQDRIKYCIMEMSHAAEVCLSDGAYDIFKLVRNYLELVLEGGCYQQGRRLATMMHTAYVIRESTSQRNALLNCLTQAQEKRNKTMDDPARVYSYYQELSVIKNCLLEEVGETDTQEFRTDVADFIKILEERMMCFHPEDRSVVLCKTIESK